MRRLACLVLLGALHPVMASEPTSAPSTQSAPVSATPVRDVATAPAVAPAAGNVQEQPTVATAAAPPQAETGVAAAAQGAPAAAGYVPKTPYDNSPYRFDMSQQGKRMSAADFDAWMKARGLRVAGGKPQQPAAAEPAAPPAPLACQPAPTLAC